jgi:hypothetical protein
MQLIDPIYPIPNILNLTPCADGAGEVVATGPGSIWKAGDRVMMHPMGWIDEEDLPDLVGMKGKGAGNVHGTLRQFGVYVCQPNFFIIVHGKIINPPNKKIHISFPRPHTSYSKT